MQARGSALALKPRAAVTRSPQQAFNDPQKRTHVLQNICKKVMISYWMKDAIQLCYKEIEKRLVRRNIA